MQIGTRTTARPEPASRKSVVNRLSFCVLVALLLTGCAALKNPAPPPLPSVVAQWRPRYEFSVRVQTSRFDDLAEVTNRWERQWKMQSALSDARRIAEVLSTCRLFEKVVVSNAVQGTNELVIEALPNARPYADPDEVWLMMYGGVFPIYDRVDSSVRFRCLSHGGTNSFVFPWTEESVIGFWAPAVAAIGHGWRLAPPLWWKCPAYQSSYWSDLRASLIEKIDQIEAARE
jgi:hypothetical protein